jgi:protein-S-isoprenylcysteine O-methyltransferase Ste14
MGVRACILASDIRNLFPMGIRGFGEAASPECSRIASLALPSVRLSIKKFVKWLLSALYGLMMMEVIIMISPFAFYWYSLYAPTLQSLHHWRATAWLEAFFLPHSVITTSAVLEFTRWTLGTYCFSLGILAFVFCAGQVYAAKLFHRGLVMTRVYSRIRHPQYLSLAIAGFGLLTIWPRIIILVLYLGMLFAYYFLARFEEIQEEARHPEYAEYRRRTAMFIPGDPGGKLFRLFFGWMSNRRLALALSSVVVIALVIGGGLMLRRYTIGHAATELLPKDRVMAISIWPMPAEKIEQVVDVALKDDRVRAALAKESGAVFTAHVLPQDYGMVNMFADVGTDHRMFSRLSPGRFKYLIGFIFPFLAPGQKYRIMGTPEDNYKVIFSRVDEPGRPSITADNVTDLTAKMTPVVIAEIGPFQAGADPVLQDVVIPPRRSFWGDITMPMF